MPEVRHEARKRKASPPAPQSRQPPKSPAAESITTPSDHYDLLEAVGSGTFSVVRKARRDSDAATVAVKRLKKLDQAAARIRDEVSCLRALSGCPHIVRLLDCHHRKGDNQIDIIMPYFEHADFADALAEGKFTPVHTRCYLRGLFDALAYMHERGFVHRDIKPGNALYSFETRMTIVVDFGLVQSIAAPAAAAASAPTSAVASASTSAAASASVSAAPAALAVPIAPAGHHTNHALPIGGGLPPPSALAPPPPQPLPPAGGASGIAAGLVRRANTAFGPPAGASRGARGLISRPPNVVNGNARAGGAGGTHGRPTAPAARRASESLFGPSVKRPAVGGGGGGGVGGGGGGGVSQLAAAASTPIALHSFVAHREGTRGFRAPEVLLRKHEQGPPIDMWAAGVIALCLATRRYPAFTADSDVESLVESVAVVLKALHSGVHEPRGARGPAAELGAPGSRVVDRVGRLMLTTFPPGHTGGIGEGVSAWSAALGGEGGGGASRDDGDEGDARMRLWEVLDGCLRLDEGERRTAKQMLEMPLFAEMCV